MSALLDREGFRRRSSPVMRALRVLWRARADAHHLIERKLFSEPDETAATSSRTESRL